MQTGKEVTSQHVLERLASPTWVELSTSSVSGSVQSELLVADQLRVRQCLISAVYWRVTHVVTRCQVPGDLDVVGEPTFGKLVRSPLAVVRLLPNLYCPSAIAPAPAHTLLTLIQGEPLSAFQLEHPEAGHLAM